jgi:hypothetical protein
MHLHRIITRATLLIALAGGVVRAADAPTGGPIGVRAFVLSNIYIATPPEPDVCTTLTASGPETFFQSLALEEQDRYRGDDKHNQLFRLMQDRLGFKWLTLVPRGKGIAPAGQAQTPTDWQMLEVDADPAESRIERLRERAQITPGKGAIVFNNHILAYDSCTNPEDFPMLDRNLHPYDGKLAFGMNLDGKTTRNNFSNSRGEKGIDNQLWRVLGCMKHFREFGNPDNANSTLFSVAAPTLIEITGIDNPRNDNDVEVAVYASADALSADNRGRALAHASFDVDTSPALTAHTHGRIVDGVLITEPVDIHLRAKEQILDTVRELRAARIRATLNADGSIEGGFYGYYTLTSFYDSIKQMSQLGVNLSSLSCPVIYNAIKRYADGVPDPQSHQYTAISSALNFVGVSAFVIHQPPAIGVADTATP